MNKEYINIYSFCLTIYTKRRRKITTFKVTYLARREYISIITVMKKLILILLILFTGCNDDNFNNAYYNLTKNSRAEDKIQQEHDTKHDVTIKVIEFEKDATVKKYTAQLTDPNNNNFTLHPDTMGVVKQSFYTLTPGIYNIKICYAIKSKEYTGSNNFYVTEYYNPIITVYARKGKCVRLPF